jgi:hypothetical protein
MATVGSVLIASRELGPDMPQSLSAPSISSLVGAAGALTIATYYVKVTALNEYGESLGSSESSVAAATGFTVTFSSVLGATSYRIYFGTASGAQDKFVAASASPVSVTSLASASAGAPPSRGTAWLPDTDGSFVSAFTLYRWLNEGLKMFGRVTGGIMDYTAFQTTTQTGVYQLGGQWLKFTHGWFDGWPIAIGAKHDTFQKTRVQGITNVAVPFKQNDVQFVELWPIPNRTALSTTLNGAVTATDTSATLTSVLLGLDHGFLLIEDELCYYGQISGNDVVQLVRGLGGTAAVAHTDGATVKEANFRLAGYRMPETYAVGDSAKTLAVPPAWEALLPRYLLSRYKEAEQDMGAAGQLRQSVEQELNLLAKANKPLLGPTQMGNRSGVTETIPGMGSLGGGIIRL